jgi:hypothetical protein
MNSMQRTLATLGFQEPDRVPLFLLTTLHGAAELGMSIEDYFSQAEHVAEGQMRLLAKYGGDCLYPFFHASIETEAPPSLWRDPGARTQAGRTWRPCTLPATSRWRCWSNWPRPRTRFAPRPSRLQHERLQHERRAGPPQGRTAARAAEVA